MRKIYLILCFGVFLLSACNRNKTMNFTIVDRFTLKDIPSASGIEFTSDAYWIIGDNSPWLYELTPEFKLHFKYPIFSIDSLENGIIPKKRKHDFEAITRMKWDQDSALFIFGSGSKSPTRNFGKLILIDETVTPADFDLTEFYQKISEKAKLKEGELNLEAAAVLNKKLYLFNRGNNKMIIVKVKDFRDYLIGKKEDIKIKVHTIELPEINGIPAGFSGATADEANNRLIFTASVENTSNWIDDGSVLGSFVGIIDVKKSHQHYIPDCYLLAENEEPLLIKVESISITKAEKNDVNCILVTDNDGGQSELIKIEFHLK